jgi:hypothetical protein
VWCSLWGTDWILKYYLDELRLQRVKRTAWTLARRYKKNKQTIFKASNDILILSVWRGIISKTCAFARVPSYYTQRWTREVSLQWYSFLNYVAILSCTLFFYFVLYNQNRVSVFAYSSRMDTPVCSKLGMLIFWNKEEILEGQKLRKNILGLSLSEGGSCSSETEHNRSMAPRPKLFVSASILQEQRPQPEVFWFVSRWRCWV